MNSILTVSSVNTYLSFKLKNDPKLKGIAVKGEISDISINYNSGHIYFSLTDGKSTLKAVMFSSNAERLKFVPETGDSVVAFGGIDVYERGGVYQLNCTQLFKDGVGNESFKLAQLKSELEKLGVFSKPKKIIPKYPKTIAVVTSPHGAAIEDVKSVVQRRYPIADLIIFPATVQGLTAPKSIAEALENADLYGADVIILTRGGGSNEDLSCFNTKEAVLAVYSCKTPVISAVGHEINTTLCDLVADMRAPTPSGAAELATPDISEIREEVLHLRAMISSLAEKKILSCENAVDGLKSIISAYSPISKLNSFEERVVSYKSLISKLALASVQKLENEVCGIKRTIESFDNMKTVARGYALVYSGDELITSKNDIKTGETIKIVMKDGEIFAEVRKG